MAGTGEGGMGQGARAHGALRMVWNHVDLRDVAWMGEWSLLVAPAVLGGVSLFVVVLASVEARLFD